MPGIRKIENGIPMRLFTQLTLHETLIPVESVDDNFPIRPQLKVSHTMSIESMLQVCAGGEFPGIVLADRLTSLDVKENVCMPYVPVLASTRTLIPG
jgi:hypothetical protein